MREVVQLRVRRLLVQVFEQDQCVLILGIVDDALQPLESGLHPHFLIRDEMITGVYDDPLGAELAGDVDIGS